jgi:sulfotransferase family protein
VVGAGLGRTGTHSLKLALEQLLGGPCYHMIEVFDRPDDIPVWHRAVNGDLPDWHEFLRDYRAAVDWPVAAFWRELMAAYPDALVLLSVRPTDEWWTSANNTIFGISRREPPPDPVFGAQMRMAVDMLNKFDPDWSEEGPAKAAYEAHNDEVRATVPSDRLLEWQPGNGWEPICTALDLPVPDEAFPHVNTTDEFQAMVTGLQAGSDGGGP